MTRAFSPARLDVAAFADAGGSLAGTTSLQRFPRVLQEAAGVDGATSVTWEARGERRAGAGQRAAAWLHLVARTRLPLVCQRCLGPMDVDLDVDRWFRFVADEALAAAEDEVSEEDVLAAGRDFDLLGLIEDELLMEIPVAPRHEVCPATLPFTAADAAFERAESQRPNPFDALEALRGPKHE